VCFTLCIYDLQHEGPHGGLSTKGERSLWQKMDLPLLNLAIGDVSWELFEGQF
jgi:hypothetical protein